MAPSIVQETGGGNDSTCNSYITLADCTAYHEEMGNATWAAAIASPDSARISAIIRGCRAIDRLFIKKFSGRPANYGVQSMQWPRVGALVLLDNFTTLNLEYSLVGGGYIIPSTIVPPEVKKACCEAALVELVSPGDMTPDLDRGGKIASVQAGSVSVSFEPGASPLTIRTAIEGILFPLLKLKGNDLVLG